MKKSKNKILFWLGLIFISVALAGGIIFYLTKHFGQVKAPEKTTSNVINSDEKIVAPNVAGSLSLVGNRLFLFGWFRISRPKKTLLARLAQNVPVVAHIYAAVVAVVSEPKSVPPRHHCGDHSMQHRPLSAR